MDAKFDQNCTAKTLTNSMSTIKNIRQLNGQVNFVVAKTLMVMFYPGSTYSALDKKMRNCISWKVFFIIV